MSEEKNTDKQHENEDQSTDEEKRSVEDMEKDREQLEALLKSIKRLEEEKRKRGKGPKRPKGTIAIEFGTVFHPNMVINFIGYYMMNLTIIYTVVELFAFGAFRDLQTVLLYVLIYTAIETVFRMYMLINHFQFVVRSLGFIFYLGYLTIFYLLNVYVFPRSVIIYEDAFFVAFVALFVLIRYILTKVFRDTVFRG